MSEDVLDNLIKQLKLPPKNLAKLSFCATKVAKVREWVESLPATRISTSSVMLYQSLPELARLDNNPLHRLDMLLGQHRQYLATVLLEHAVRQAARPQ